MKESKRLRKILHVLVIYLFAAALLPSGCLNRDNGIILHNQVDTVTAPSVPASSGHPLVVHITNILPKVNLPPRIREHIQNDLAENARFLRELLDIFDGDPKLWILVNKNKPLDARYEPGDLIDLTSGSGMVSSRMLRRAAYEAAEEIRIAAESEGLTLTVISAYRSFEHQGRTYTYWVTQEGQAEADRISARPGHSQHQLGFTVDFNMLDNELALTPEGAWLVENASRFGWSLSYPDGYENLTGYAWESWHHRYVGRQLAAFIDRYFDGIQHYALSFIDEFLAELLKSPSFSPIVLSIYGQS